MKGITLRRYLLYGFALIIGLATNSLFVELIKTNFNVPSYSANIISAVITIVFFLMVIYAYDKFTEQRLPITYDVAIIGFPASGKTTLITSIFSEIFNGKIKEIETRIISESTIDRVNDNLRRLESGKALSPTTNQDRFSYETLVRAKRSSFFSANRFFNVEFGDFPGDDTAKYIKNYGRWLHKTPFFNWARRAQAFVFVVDLALFKEASILLDKDPLNTYIADFSSAIRTYWLSVLKDKEPTGKEEVRNNPLILVFAKSDLLFSKDSFLIYNENKAKKPDKQKVPRVFEILDIDKENLELMEKRIRSIYFSELIKYLDQESRAFDCVFTSAFATQNGERLGIKELLDKVLPIRQQ